MKASIITEGGRDIGFGHVIRCLSLYEAFLEKGIATEFIVSGDEIVKNLVRDNRCEVFNWLKEKEKLFMFLEDAGIAVIDSYLAGIDFYKKISETVENPVYIDDNKRLDYPRGTVLNGNIYAPAMKYPKKEDTVYLLGSRYALLRKEFYDVPGKVIKENVESIMLTFGGNDAKNMVPLILRFLNDKYPETKKNVIIGAGFRHIKEIERLIDKKSDLIFNPSAVKMRDTMLGSDIAVSAGGQSLYELARVGLPAIGVCTAENQINNVEGWAQTGFLEYIGWYAEKDILTKLSAAVEKMKPYAERLKCSRAGRNAVDGKGVDRLFDVLSITEKI